MTLPEELVSLDRRRLCHPLSPPAYGDRFEDDAQSGVAVEAK